MGGLKTLLVVLLMMPGATRAGQGSLTDTFATCAGRLSAELEHAWLIVTDRTDEIAAHRRQFIDLLDASLPNARQRHALNLRIEAKAAHARLLTQARFETDPARSHWAVLRARSEIAYCTGFLLKG